MHINGSRMTKNVKIKWIAVVDGKFLRKNTNLLKMHQHSPVRTLNFVGILESNDAAEN